MKVNPRCEHVDKHSGLRCPDSGGYCLVGTSPLGRLRAAPPRCFRHRHRGLRQHSLRRVRMMGLVVP